MRPKRLPLLFVALATSLAPALAAQTSGDCYTYSNSSVTPWGPYQYQCAGVGGTCRECTYFHPGGHEVCYDGGNYDTWCIDYQDI